MLASDAVTLGWHASSGGAAPSAAALGAVQLNRWSGVRAIKAAHGVLVARAEGAVRQNHLHHLARSGEPAIASRPHREVLGSEVVRVDLAAAHPFGERPIESGSPSCGDSFRDLVDQRVLIRAIDVEDDEIGVTEILDRPTV